MNSIRTAARRVREQDAGLTLVELIIYSLLLSVIVAIGGGMLISSITTQRDVTRITTATSDGQVVASSVEEGIRNAGGSTPISVASNSFGQVLKSRTAKVTQAGAVTWECRAWFHRFTGEVYTRRSATAVPTPATAGDLAGWTLLAQGVTLAPGQTAIFQSTGSTAAPKVRVVFDIAGTDTAPVRIDTDIAALKTPTTGTAPASCA
ncbi:hypothetical protein CLV46_2834 [Diaminobutyricimonas aerilata]|uniref:Prepilin-type N-terminal cleavage/methylation domain-containing protein n=1 Tax=Diaminobutyricimonas aerilata TaxID=1162967 RepID=A0A2M9CMZ7_9MICO|nr:hypothetical protein [Diaminobutyricimonas aerilata]PJJ73248.1 hypothetical protein CLV46_2834 [Diaminobutyricimonas aerilata]